MFGRSRADKTANAPLALHNIDDNLCFTGHEVWAWFVLPTQPWAFRSDRQREQLMHGVCDGLAWLAGYRLHLRITSRPYPTAEWAKQLHELTPDALETPGVDSWSEHMVTLQKHLRHQTMADKQVFLGVRLASRPPSHRLISALWRHPGNIEHARLLSKVEQATETVTLPGLEGRPATAPEMEWLVRRSMGIGLPAPAALCASERNEWDPDDLHSFADSVEYAATPLGRTVALTSRGLHDPVERHVAVMSVGRLEEIEAPDPSQEPWLAHTDRLPFPVEWSCVMDVLSGGEARKAIQQKLLVVRDMQRHYAEHDLDEPLALGRQAHQARVVEDQMTRGVDVTAARIHGWFRLAVAGRTQEECLERARRVTTSYRSRRVSIEHPRGQYGLLREFIPGEPLSTTAYRRRLPALYVSAGVPAASSRLGDRRGPYIGYTVGASRRAVMFDTHYATEVRETSGLVPVVGGLGAGKALGLGTPLVTPTGWTTMGEVRRGDQLIGRDGKPTTVVATTDVMHGRPCYEVVFSDGERIVADAEHQWLTRDRKGYKRQAKYVEALANHPTPNRGPSLCACGCGMDPGIRTGHDRQGERRDYVHGHSRRGIGPTTSGDERARTTEEIAATLTWGANDQRNHAIRLAAPLALPDATLLVPPYTLGAWLGDGTTRGAGFSSADPEIPLRIEMDGVVVTKVAGPYAYSLTLPGGQRECRRCGLVFPTPVEPYGLRDWRPSCPACGQRRSARPSLVRHLRLLGVIGNKHIPPAYLRASEGQRRALLAGLLDTDGTVSKRGSIEFAVTSGRLARDTLELVRSLGYKPALRTKRVKGRTEASSTCYTVAFTSADKVFSLTRKAARQVVTGRATNRYRYIVEVNPVDSVPVRCVQVDNADHLYLAGQSMIPTHNSVLLGLLTYEAVRRGIPSVVLDPSGPLARLTELPELKAHAEHLDLTAAASGTLNPFDVVATPVRAGFPSEDAFGEAQVLASQDRKLLAMDVIKMLLPPSVSALPHTSLVVSDAVRATRGDRTSSLWNVVEHLDRMDEGHGRVVANYLRDMAELPLSRLFFPQAEPGAVRMSSTLTVLTMPGLVLPPRTVPREHWSTSEQLAVPLLHLAAWYATRAVYGRDMQSRKLVALDETHFLGDWSAGRALFTRLGRDSRKWNACVLASSQNPADVLGMDVANFMSAAFVGRIEDEDAARDGLRMLRVATGVGYERALATLSLGRGPTAMREFVMRDVDGNVDKLCVDLSANPGLLEALNTTAGRNAVAVQTVAQNVTQTVDETEHVA